MKAKTETQRLMVLSKEFGKNIKEIQIHESEGFVFLFYPNFWWFKHRIRIKFELFENILENRELSCNEIVKCNQLDWLQK